LQVSATTFQTYSTTMFFDKRLFSCTDGNACSFTSTWNTNCVWDSISWKCTITKGAENNYFRLYSNPKRVKISMYLAEI
jgi:hypothetical protein